MKITDEEFKELKLQAYYIIRLLPLTFYTNDYSVEHLLKSIDTLRKMIIGVVQDARPML